MNIHVSLYGFPVHSMSIDLCNSTNPIAKKDGFDLCPYVANETATFHDTNTIPKFVPWKGPYNTKISLTDSDFPGTNGKYLMCFEYNQTYASN